MRATVTGIWKSIRPSQSIKNLFVFAPIFFSGHATDPRRVLNVLMVFLAFSALASSTYLFNDIVDRNRDSKHPEKCRRPIASGAVSVPLAVICALLLAVVALVITSTLGFEVISVLLGYVILNVAYTLYLKHVVILDVFCLALGFVLRVVAGGLATEIQVSSWLVITTFLLSLFLGLAKRRHELILLEDGSNDHRPVLGSYSPSLLDQLIAITAPVTIITYLLYTLNPETMERFHSNLVYATGIFVVFGIFRYLFLVHLKDLGGAPGEVLTRDVPLLLTVVGWMLLFAYLVYGPE